MFNSVTFHRHDILIYVPTKGDLFNDEGEDRGKGDREKRGGRKERKGGRKEKKGGRKERKEIKGENEETKK